MPDKSLIVIVGPTAVGKTAIGVELAKKLSCAVISADSRQLFKEMQIGTAKPTTARKAATVVSAGDRPTCAA